ncbi:MAG: hypothetical protein ACI845_004311 [Gammaproteobacteria bacterium]|jgi:hypothetical protein
MLQEFLSGYTDKPGHENIRQKQLYFPNESTRDADYEAAAEYSNFFRSQGVQGSHVVFFDLRCGHSLKVLNLHN